MDGPIALGRYGAETALVTRSGEIVSHAQDVLLLFRPSWMDHALLRKAGTKIYDLAELWGVMRPGLAPPPTLLGMTGRAPESAEDSAVALYALMDELLEEARQKSAELAPWLAMLKMEEGKGDWPWLNLLPEVQEDTQTPDIIPLIKDVPKWALGAKTPQPEPKTDVNLRPIQKTYYEAVRNYFDGDALDPLVAEGGTGVGKTRAYLWAAAQSDEPVWISTFTRNLQQQVQREALQHLGVNVHIRKGRDNYLCLRILNSLAQQQATAPNHRVRLAIVSMLRWMEATDAGDLTGADFPGWFVALYGSVLTLGTADRNRECNYQGCPFYANCFAEKARHLTTQADLVVGNHALIANLRHSGLPKRLIMDEAHHVEHVMDEALSAGFSYVNLSILSRFLFGIPSGTRARARRGFLEGWQEALPEDVHDLIKEVRSAAQILPESTPVGQREEGPLLSYLYQIEQYIAEQYQGDNDSAYDWDIERDDVPPPPSEAITALSKLHRAMVTLLERVDFLDRQAMLLDEEAVDDPRKDVFIDMAVLPVKTWLSQLEQLGKPLSSDFIEWAAVKREEGGEKADVGIFRAFTKPLNTWQNMAQSGGSQIVYATATPTQALHALEGTRISVASPFDYPAQSKVLVLSDVNSLNSTRTAEAIAALSEASGGSALAIFTAIARLRGAYAMLEPLAEAANLNIVAQHEQRMDVATLINLFRSEPRSVLLGTDAIRDGVDIPGDALRLLIYDRVPWSRPTILHKKRKALLGGTVYEENQVKLKLKQAYGRLIRHEADRGVFVMLDSRLPTRLYDAFPQGVSIEKVTLEEAVVVLKGFFENPGIEISRGAGATGGEDDRGAA